MFNMHVTVSDQPLDFTREGDQFIMQVLIKAGYTSEALSHLNRVRVSLQLLFMSDILMASGNKVCTDILSCRPQGEAWSKMKQPHKCPTDSDMMLWKDAMLSICPPESHLKHRPFHRLFAQDMAMVLEQSRVHPSPQEH